MHLLPTKLYHKLKTTREIAKVNSRREALSIAANECRYFAENIIPLINEFNKKVEEFDIQLLTKSKVEVSDDYIKVSPFIDYDHFEETKNKIISNAADVSNALEGFATFFISGVADEDLAYVTVGSAYCYIVKKTGSYNNSYSE